MGRKRYQEEKKAKREGKPIEYSKKQLSHIDRDGSFSVKNRQVHCGYKNHTKTDVDNHLICDYDITTASVHDNNIDLIEDFAYNLYQMVTLERQAILVAT